MKSGHVVFQGATATLLQETRDKVWIITTQGEKPQGDVTIVSTMHGSNQVQYRVVGELHEQQGAIPAEPGLEDAYVWLMREQRKPHIILT